MHAHTIIAQWKEDYEGPKLAKHLFSAELSEHTMKPFAKDLTVINGQCYPVFQHKLR
jgi:hypothetical protein